MIYITQGGQRSGPFPETEVKDKFLMGKIAALDLVWSEGMDKWITMKDFADQRHWVAPSTPPPPPSLKVYKEYCNMTCRECGYTGQMGVTGTKKPWWVSIWAEIILVVLFALVYGFFFVFNWIVLLVFYGCLAALRYIFTKKLVDCPNCGKSLKQM